MVPKPELTLVIYKSTTGPHISCKARNLNVCLCMCCSNISADQDQTELRVSTWLLHGSRVCKVAFVWTTMIPLIIYFINALPISLALLTVATTVTCAPEPITAELKPTTTSRFIPAAARAGPGFCGGLVPFCSMHLNSLLWILILRV